jgi:putative salt-induced outer membrane protein YdiY
MKLFSCLVRSCRTVVCFATALYAGSLGADTIETRDGARIVGTITRIDDGEIEVETAYAGKIKIKQDHVIGLTTDAPVSVRLASGTRFDGRVVSGPGGAVQIAGVDGSIATSVDRIAASWAAGQVDPRLDRRWTYEASVDVSGKTGNSEQIGTAGEVRAKLTTVQDTLQFYTNYNRQMADGLKAADQLKLGVDYQNNFAGRYSWYVRDEGGFDRVKDIELYNIAAAGIGRDFIKEPKRTLTGRLGLSFRYEGYRDPASEDVRSAGIDVGVLNDMEFFGISRLVTRLTFVPTFEDFGNYRLMHESFYQIPLAHPAWKLRIGLSNDYNSRPPTGVKELDTTYFTRLVLNWQ